MALNPERRQLPPLSLMIVGALLPLPIICLLLDPPASISLVNGLLVGVVAVVLTLYAPQLWDGMSARRVERAHIYLIGTFLLWTAYGLSRVLSSVWRSMGQPEWLISSYLNTSLVYLAIIAGVLHVVSPPTTDGSLLGPPRPLLIGGILLGLVLGILTIVGQQQAWFDKAIP